MYYPTLPEHIEMFALCLDAKPSRDSVFDMVNSGRCYKVIRFVDQDGFFPYGVRVADYRNNELDQTFFVQRFRFFEYILN